MTAILAVDPGSALSAWLLWEGRVVDFGIWPNETLLHYLRRATATETVVIEKIESYGMAVGREVFDTVHWSGRFTEAAESRGIPVEHLTRRTVKVALCGSAKAKDANVRVALLDRFGGASAKGTKAAPGPLYGISADVWAALAVAVVWTEQEEAR